MMQTNEDKLVSLEYAAERLGLHPATLRLWAHQRKIASVKLGRRRLIPESEIDRLVETNLIPALPQARTETVTE
jgi:excisionase family DNA binding protein